MSLFIFSRYTNEAHRPIMIQKEDRIKGMRSATMKIELRTSQVKRSTNCTKLSFSISLFILLYFYFPILYISLTSFILFFFFTLSPLFCRNCYQQCKSSDQEQNHKFYVKHLEANIWEQQNAKLRLKLWMYANSRTIAEFDKHYQELRTLDGANCIT